MTPDFESWYALNERRFTGDVKQAAWLGYQAGCRSGEYLPARRTQIFPPVRPAPPGTENLWGDLGPLMAEADVEADRIIAARERNQKEQKAMDSILFGAPTL